MHEANMQDMNLCWRECVDMSIYLFKDISIYLRELAENTREWS